MICDNCKIERLVSDFINNQKFCYRCEYRKKLEKLTGKQAQKINKCRMCSKEIFHKENLKKRQRSVFCSRECALKGHKELSRNHWTRKGKTDVVMNIASEGARMDHWKN